MKNKKGFTLTELLAVLVILALILTLSFPNFSDLASKAKSNYDRSTQVLIRSAAKMYVNNNTQEIENALKSSSSYCLPIGKLIAYEYLDSDLNEGNSSRNVQVNEQNCVMVSKSGDTYNYNLNFATNPTATGDYKPPIINIVGTNCKNVMNVNSYTDFDNACTIKVTDNIDATKTFKPIREKEDDNNLSKVVVFENNKIFITYNAKDAAGNKAIPIQIELVLPE